MKYYRENCALKCFWGCVFSVGICCLFSNHLVWYERISSGMMLSLPICITLLIYNTISNLISDLLSPLFYTIFDQNKNQTFMNLCGFILKYFGTFSLVIVSLTLIGSLNKQLFGLFYFVFTIINLFASVCFVIYDYIICSSFIQEKNI